MVDLTNERGSLTTRYSYDEWGVPNPDSKFGFGGERANTYGFTGEDYDQDIALLYLRARYYMPDMGRFISRDPFPGFITEPQSKHPYLYCYNIPTKYTDPSGMWLGIDDVFTGPIDELIVVSLITTYLSTPAGKEMMRGACEVITDIYNWAKKKFPKEQSLSKELQELHSGWTPKSTNLFPKWFDPKKVPKWKKWIIGGTIVSYIIHTHYKFYEPFLNKESEKKSERG